MVRIHARQVIPYEALTRFALNPDFGGLDTCECPLPSQCRHLAIGGVRKSQWHENNFGARNALHFVDYESACWTTVRGVWLYDEDRRFKDHDPGRPTHRGDSFDFYCLASGELPSQAFKDFVTLAGLKHELRTTARTRTASLHGANGQQPPP